MGRDDKTPSKWRAKLAAKRPAPRFRAAKGSSWYSFADNGALIVLQGRQVNGLGDAIFGVFGGRAYINNFVKIADRRYGNGVSRV